MRHAVAHGVVSSNRVELNKIGRYTIYIYAWKQNCCADFFVEKCSFSFIVVGIVRAFHVASGNCFIPIRAIIQLHQCNTFFSLLGNNLSQANKNNHHCFLSSFCKTNNTDPNWTNIGYTSVRTLVINTISLLCVTSVNMSGNRAIVYFETQAPLSESLRATCCPLKILANLLSLKKAKIPHCCVKWSVSFHLGGT